MAFGATLGTLVMYPLAGYLCEYGFAGGWPSVFYVIAMLHVPWVLLWVYFVDDTPSKSRRISNKELQYIKSKIETFSSSKVLKFSFNLEIRFL
jgi:MFS family permease